ncbi:MAG: hypothetical protein RLZZ524_3011 [Pseudomonadota bacterium]|jgi:DNA-binding protein H-NS
MTTTRIYAVSLTAITDEPGVVSRLVRAGNASQALRHVARDTLTVKVASQDDLVANLSAGVKVETAGDEAEPAPAPTEEKSLPLWPMPGQQAQSPDEDGDDEEAAPASIRPPKRLPAKYRDELTGSTWSGRGLMPTWLKVALSNDPGRKLDDFLVKEEAPQQA